MNMQKQHEKKYPQSADFKLRDLATANFPHAKTLLDLGCGSGGNLKMFRGIGFDCIGITLSPEEKNEASKHAPVLIHNLEEGLPNNLNQRFDLVLAAHVLEHIFYPEKLLQDIKRVGTQGAIIVIPNLLFWRNRVKLLLGIFEYSNLGIMDYTHCRWYTYKSIQRILATYGFEVLQAEATGGLFQRKSSIFRVIDGFLLKTFPGIFGFQFYIVVKIYNDTD
ncbi:MAG: hypothetical protein B7X82_15020 [Hydrogenophilales bacterium 17-64-65]|nr:MAG: hypothetical protein B7Y27_11000 [Hydrogenophilales bacterium 16-64-40]OZA31872.1 MAG: hypothetical protein B7X82_15020 [Hydrogenophilales bacterium 17-64-65]